MAVSGMHTHSAGSPPGSSSAAAMKQTVPGIKAMTAFPTAFPLNSVIVLDGREHRHRQARAIDGELVHRQRQDAQQRDERRERGEAEAASQAERREVGRAPPLRSVMAANMPKTTIGESSVARPRGVRRASRIWLMAIAEVPRETPGSRHRLAAPPATRLGPVVAVEPRTLHERRERQEMKCRADAQ